jgi:hypothetical protein
MEHISLSSEENEGSGGSDPDSNDDDAIGTLDATNCIKPGTTNNPNPSFVGNFYCAAECARCRCGEHAPPPPILGAQMSVLSCFSFTIFILFHLSLFRL